MYIAYIPNAFCSTKYNLIIFNLFILLYIIVYTLLICIYPQVFAGPWYCKKYTIYNQKCIFTIFMFCKTCFICIDKDFQNIDQSVPTTQCIITEPRFKNPSATPVFHKFFRLNFLSIVRICFCGYTA